MQQQLTQYNQTDVTRQVQEPPSLAGLTKNRMVAKYGMNEQERALYDAEMSMGLLTLRTAFPTQSRNYSDREFDMLTALWLEIFVEIERGILNEAIIRFVTADRKGFFPSPGQVMGIVEDIQAERKAKIDEERLERHREYLRQIQRRIDNGENCSTCKFCVKRMEKSMRDRKMEERLFCQNPESYKYEGEHGYGTAAGIICDFYEPENAVTVEE
jgi:hypothetical protein